MAALSPFFNAQFIDTNDDGVLTVAAGYLLYAFETGTSTPKDTYTDQSGDTEETHPIELDDDGRCALWLGDGEYAFELRDPDDALVKRWDDVGGIPVASDTAFVPIAGGVTMTGRINLSGAAISNLQPVTLQQMTAAIAASASDGATSAELDAAVADLEADIALKMDKAANLSDVASAATSRTNLSVYSSAEVDTLKVAKSGSTLTGFLVLHADAASAMNPVTKQQMDAAVAAAATHTEGSWTPTLTFNYTAAGVAYGSRQGDWCKDGNFWTLLAYIEINTTGGSGVARIGGLPAFFANSYIGEISISGGAGITGKLSCIAVNNGGTTYLELRENTGTDDTDTLANTQIIAGTHIHVSIKLKA